MKKQTPISHPVIAQAHAHGVVLYSRLGRKFHQRYPVSEIPHSALPIPHSHHSDSDLVGRGSRRRSAISHFPSSNAPVRVRNIHVDTAPLQNRIEIPITLPTAA